VNFRIASNAGPPGSNYFILLILTDGIITDMEQTCEAIVNVGRIMCRSVCLSVWTRCSEHLFFTGF